jgi:nucleoside-diphosphate-sugar epimerase
LKQYSIYLTGSSGFVGTTLKEKFSDYKIFLYNRNDTISIDSDIVIHLAGKSTDTKNEKNISEYYVSNTELTSRIFDEFINSNARKLIVLSSIKAVRDFSNEILTEDSVTDPSSHYGKSKLLAEQYILSKKFPNNKKVYILRPCLIHGPGNNGNLNLLYKIVSKGLPWPLGSYNNLRSFCSIDNLLFIIREIIERDDIPSGIYNVADDESISTNDLIKLMAQSLNKKPKIWMLSTRIINLMAKIGDKLHLPINSERLHKLIDSNVVSNSKIKIAIGKNLPIAMREGFVKTFLSFKR